MTDSWYVARDPDGSISRVIRIRDEPSGLRGEYLQDGVWVQDEVVLQVKGDETWGLPVSAQEGEKTAHDLEAADRVGPDCTS